MKRAVVAALLVVSMVCGLWGAAAAQKPVLVGASLSLSGKYAKGAEFQNQAYQLWVEQVNARGGLLGRPVELRIYDDRSDPATGVRLYEKLISEDRVDLLVGPYSSAVTAAVSTVSEKHRRAMVAPMAAANDIWQRGYRYVFQVITPASLYFIGGIELAAGAGLKHVAVTGEDSDYPRDALPAAARRATELGLQVTDLGYYPKGTKDFSAIITRAKTVGAAVLVCGCYEPDAIQLIRQAKELDYSAKMYVFGVGPALPEFAKALGKDAEFVMGSDHWDPRVKTPGNAEFVAAFQRKFGREPNYHAAGSYGGMQVLEAALKRAGSLDQDKIRQELVQLDIATIFGRYKVTDAGAQTGKSAFIIQWQGRKKEIVWPPDAASARAVIPAPAWSERR